MSAFIASGIEMLAAAAPRVGGRARTAIPAAALSGGGGSSSSHFNKDAGGPTFASTNHKFFDTRGLVTRAPSRRLVHGSSDGSGAIPGTAAILDPDQAASLDEDGGAAAARGERVGVVRGQIKGARAEGEGSSLRFLRIRGVGALLSEKEKAAPAPAGGKDAQADAATAATATATPPSPSSNAPAAAAGGEYPYTFPMAPDLVILRSLPDLAEGISDVASRVRSKVKLLQAKTRAATLLQTHPPLPVVGTFEELLRFANIASLNSAKEEDIEAFFSHTGEEVTVLDMASVKQRLFVATDHRRRLHTISFRGTTNLTNVVQNIRLNSNPVKASGKLASVGRSLSGAFMGLRSSSSSSSSSSSRASSSSGDDSCGSGSFDEDDDDDVCGNVAWDAADGERVRTGCTDHLPMHRGYRIVARECRDAIAPLLQQGYSVQLTGHSLGGAVAVALALLYKAAGKDVAKVVTFGAPKLGPKETRDAAESLNILRVVQKDDIIPLLPMSRPFVRKPYVHLGEGIMLDNDAPGRYAKLTREWGTAGILWRQRAHTGYAAGTASAGAANGGGGGRGRISVKGITGDGVISGGARRDVLVSADDADNADSVDAMSVDAAGAPVGSGAGEGGGGGISAGRSGRWQRAKARLSSLRAALREGIAARAAGVSLMTPSTTVGADKIVIDVRTTGENLRAASRADESASRRDGISAAASPLTLRAPPISETEWAAEVAEWAHAPHEDAGNAELAPFDDVEGELFVRLAETEGGATAAAAAAATEWEKAASRAAAAASFFSASSASASTDGPAASSPATTTTSKSTSDSSPAPAVSSGEASNIVSSGSSASSAELPSHTTHRAGPTIFERLWQLRRQPAQERVDRLECHRMKRYVAAVQAAIEAGPVQTSLSAIYSGGKEGHEDDVGLDMEGAGSEDEDDDGVAEGGLASWLVWSR